MSLQIRLVRVETGTEGRKGRRYSQAAMRWPAASRWPAAAQRHQRASSVPSRGGGSGAPAQLRQARRPKHGGGRGLRRGDGAMAAPRGSDGASKLRLAPSGEWARRFGAGAGDLTQEVGELPREGGFGAGSWGRARERGDCEPAPLGEESEGEGRDSDDDSERRGMKSLKMFFLFFL